jgi:glycosyltransferase involved in cell wall biosynthesis
MTLSASGMGAPSMKIIFLVPRMDKASTRYRVLQYLPHLEGVGISCSVKSLSRTSRVWYLLVRQLHEADLVFIQKKLFTSIELFLVRKMARRLVYDFDDAVMFKDRAASPRQQERQQRRFASTVQKADLVIAGNSYLKKQTLPWNKHVEVLPTPLDTASYPEKPAVPESGEVVLGWIGSRGTLKYLHDIAPALEELGRRFPKLKLKIVADDFFSLEHLEVVRKPWSAMDELADLHSFDIGLMPLRDDEWTRGKCGFKLLQCMAVGLPVVCSPVGMNTTIVTDAREGFWATSPKEWTERLSRLIADAGLRQEMGRVARQKVVETYSLAVNAPKFLNYLLKASLEG